LNDFPPARPGLAGTLKKCGDVSNCNSSSSHLVTAGAALVRMARQPEDQVGVSALLAMVFVGRSRTSDYGRFGIGFAFYQVENQPESGCVE